MDASPSSRPLPPLVEPFRLVTQLGRGGFAPVWLAEEIHDGRKLREVALKLFFLHDKIPPGSAGAARWREGILEEARALCRVEHPNVVRFYALCRDDACGIVGLAMEHVAGKNLDVLLDEQGPFDERAVLDVGISIAWALAAVHEAGLVHRDVKPGNIIAGANGYKLIDFGIVADAPSFGPGKPSTASVPLAGTHGYVAPEYFQLGAGPTPAGDLYALGVTLFKLKHGVLPRRAEPESSPQSHVRVSSTRPTVEVDSLDSMTALLLERDPHLRPHHADWVARELERLHGRVASSPPMPRPVSPWDADLHEMATIPFVRIDHTTRRPIGEAESTPREPCPHPPMVGRSDTLAALARVAHEATEGHVRFALLTGPLGIGRTRVLDAAVEQAAAAPERVLRVRCVPERRSPLRPLLRALEALPDGGSSAFGLLIDAIERALAPAVLPRDRQGDEALEAVEDALLWAANDSLIVLAVDDVQWGDAHTLKLLQLLVERAEMGWAAQLAVFVAVRDEPNPSPPLRALLDRVRGRSRPGVRHLPLGPLAEEEAAALAQAVCPVEPALEQAVVWGSGGVPYFVVHALRAWCERGAIGWQGDAWRVFDERVLREAVPGVADLLEARLASYFEPQGAAFRAALRALAAVALYGGGLRADILFGCAGSDEQTLEAALETLVDADILAISGDPLEYSFAQEMVRQAALNLLRQRPWFHRLHRALLDALAARPEEQTDAAFLATGYEKLGERQQARTWLERAMRSAHQAGLFDEAAALGDRLAALTADPAVRADVEIEIVRALSLGGQLEQAKARLAHLDVMARGPVDGDPRHTVHSLQRRILRLEVARGCSEPADDPSLIADADALGDPALACQARMALAGVVPEARALGLCDEAVALAERLGPALEFAARVLRVELVYAANEGRDLELAEADLRRALVIATATSSTWQRIHIETDLMAIEAELGRVDEAIERLQRLTEEAEALGIQGQLRLSSYNLAAVQLRAGHAVEAATVARQTVESAARAGDPTLHAMALSLLAFALLDSGDPVKALVHANEAETSQRARSDPMLAQTLLRRAEILTALCRPDDALADARAAQDVAERHGEIGFRIAAVLWEKLHLARGGHATTQELAQALAEAKASGLTRRALLRRLVDRAEAWLVSVKSEAAAAEAAYRRGS